MTREELQQKANELGALFSLSIHLDDLGNPIISVPASNLTLTDGTQKAIIRAAAKGTTVAADVTSTNVDANTQALDVAVKGVVPLPTDAATQTTLAAQNVLIGSVTETAPATDIASSGLNGRMQRITQRLSAIISLLPASLGAKTAAASFSVVQASDEVFDTRSIVRGGAKGTTVAADVTSTDVDTNTQALDTVLKQRIKFFTDATGTITTNTTSSLIPVSELTQQFVINVTAISASDTPTYLIAIQESHDGANFNEVFSFYATAVTRIESRKIGIRGRYLRLVETVTGTSVSITRTITRIEAQERTPTFRVSVNQSIDLNTLGSTWVINGSGVSKLSLIMSITAKTTDPTVTIYGVTFGRKVSLGTLTINSATLHFKFFIADIYFDFIQVEVTTAGTGVTLFRNQAILAE